MASFLKALMRLATKSEPEPARPGDEEQGRIAGPVPAPHERRHFGQFISSHLGFGNHHHSNHVPPTNESLVLYRLLLGISTSAHLGFDQDAAGGRRPAANIGIYARVVHEEQKSKDSFKVFSVIINGCYFLQIIIAAALTALGAANADNKAITAFGAFNTITAGLLTFLKGSGLPSRYKYYGNEWKKIREFIEQRERDFSRANCTLDVYQVVETIERMYTHTKQEIEANTPDSYTSVSRNAGQMGVDSSGKIGGIDIAKLEGLASKITGLDGAVSKITAGLKDKTHGLTQGIHEREKEIEAEVKGVEKAVAKEIDEHRAKLEREARAREDEMRAGLSAKYAEAQTKGEEVRSTLDASHAAARTRLDAGKNVVSSTAQKAQERASEGMQQAQEKADEVREEAQKTEEALRESQEQIAQMGEQLARTGKEATLLVQDGRQQLEHHAERSMAGLDGTGTAVGNQLTKRGQAEALRAGEAAIRNVSDSAASTADKLRDTMADDNQQAR